MKLQMCYVVCLVLRKQEFFLLWVDGGAARDQYVVSAPGAARLLAAPNRKQIERLASCNHLTVSPQATDIFNLDAASSVLSAMRPSRHLSKGGATILLNSWNAFEDIARSTKIDLLQIAPSSKKIMDKIYEKLFYGNNLPSVSPENEMYHPAFDTNELRLLRQSFRRALKILPTLL